MLTIRDAEAGDRHSILTMNNAAVPAVNPHDPDSLEGLLAMADRTWVVDDEGVLGGLLVAFGPGADYQSKNYRWLSERYDNFGYVDRIVVAETHRRLGLAGRLYAALADHAAASGRDRLLCEVNVDPPNPQSIAFHEADGWEAVQDLEHAPGAVVRYFQKLI
ncbi:MAG: GNAT family N-acetyltransferase [Actinomycetota bacterium]